MRLLIILLSITGMTMVSAAEKEKRVSLLQTGSFEQCEGKDAANYTYISQYSLDAKCTATSNEESPVEFLIACQPNGQKVVNPVKILQVSRYPAGAYYQYEVLYLAQAGSLEGKYIYVKEIGLQEAYLKKCSSALGYAYISTKSQVLLVADRLDMNVFMNPGGAYEPFKKTASTICQGRSITV